MASLEQSRNEAKNSLTQVQQRIEELNTLIEEDKKQIIDTLNDRATIKSKMSSFDTMMEQLRIRKAELNSRLLRAKSDEAERDAEIQSLEEEFRKINDWIIDTNNHLTQLDEENTAMRAALTAKDEEIRSLQEKYQQSKSKLDTVTNLTERYEGYGGSIQKVMEQKDRNQGIIGVVADIIKVEKKYETAIETALGGNIQNIVTDDEETAKEMIEFLKKNRYGRATFLPLTSITNPQEFKTPDVLNEKGAIGLADSLVQTEKRYSNVAKAMLGRIAVIDTIDHAVKIARKYDYGVRMVTLEGELLVPGGAISGGAFKNNSNLLGRRREMEELEKRVAQSKQAMEAAKAALEEMVRQTGNPVFNDAGIMTKGVIVRHLLLPGCLRDARRIVKYLYETYGDQIYMSLMNQYTPLDTLNREKYPELAKKVTKKAYDVLVDYAIDLGVEQAFIQEGETAKESFIPDFSYEGV